MTVRRKTKITKSKKTNIWNTEMHVSEVPFTFHKRIMRAFNTVALRSFETATSWRENPELWKLWGVPPPASRQPLASAHGEFGSCRSAPNSFRQLIDDGQNDTLCTLSSSESWATAAWVHFTRAGVHPPRANVEPSPRLTAGPALVWPTSVPSPRGAYFFALTREIRLDENLLRGWFTHQG